MTPWEATFFLLAVVTLAIAWLGGRLQRDAVEMVHDFRRCFPGRCMICSYHRYLVRQAWCRDDTLPPHDCCEARHA